MGNRKIETILKITCIAMMLAVLSIGISACSKPIFEKDHMHESIEKIVKVIPPEKYTEFSEKQKVKSEQFWVAGTKDPNISFLMLTYKETPVLGFGDIDDALEHQERLDEITVSNIPVTISTIDREFTQAYGCDINATFEYRDYLLQLAMYSTNNKPLTDDHKKEFYEMVKSMEFSPQTK